MPTVADAGRRAVRCSCVSFARPISREPGVRVVVAVPPREVLAADPLDLLDVAVCPSCGWGYRIVGGLPWAA